MRLLLAKNILRARLCACTISAVTSWLYFFEANFNGDALQVYHKALKEAKHEDSASEDDDSEDQ